MGAFATKSFFKKKLKEFTNSGYNYFEISPPPDCCPECEAKANKKIMIVTATEDDYPPFHSKCRCDILSLEDNEEAHGLDRVNGIRAKYISGEWPMKRCPHCSEWTEGNSVKCRKCNKEL